MNRTRVTTLSVPRGKTIAVRLHSPTIKFNTHWSPQGGQMCPVLKCPVCEAWPSRRRVAALVWPGEGDRRYIEWPDHGDVLEFSLISLTRTAKDLVAKTEVNKLTKLEHRLPLSALLLQISDLYRLPEPDEGENAVDTIIRWHKVMRARLKIIGDQCK